MAKMCPKQIPQYMISDPGRSAEIKVYQKLEEVLEDPFTVFYSKPWLGTTTSGHAIDGECDFLIAHPDYGCIALEVKGGGIAYDPASETWTSYDWLGNPHDIKNPGRQARDSKYQILKKCQAHPKWGRRRVGFSHGVIFPDSEEINGDLGADMPRNIICYLDEFETDLRSWILDRLENELSSDYRAKPLGEEGIMILEDILCHPFKLHVPLSHILDEDEKTIKTLTPRQYQILDGLADHKRTAISGSAGTGKTILAMEEAARCVESGERVLLTCYNTPLSLYMKKVLGNKELLTIANYHGFCDGLFREAEITVNREKIGNDLFLEQYPKCLVDALARLPHKRYDTIIIDEGQDFPLSLLKSLESALDPNGAGKIRLFYDNNQDVYHNQGEYLSKLYEIPFILSLNLRNTQRIHELIQHFYKGKDTKAIGPEGVSIEWIEADSIVTMKKCLDEFIAHLTKDERVPPADIVVLISTREDKEKFSPDGKIGGLGYHFCNERLVDDSKDGIVLDSVKRFKGLESPVVIVILTEKLLESEEMLYVAFSRARSLLAVIGKKEDFEKIRNK